MGKASSYWPFHRAQTLLIMDGFGVDTFVDMSEIIDALLRKSDISHVNLIYKNMYILYEEGLVKSRTGNGRKSSVCYALTKAGAEEAAMLRGAILDLGRD